MFPVYFVNHVTGLYLYKPSPSGRGLGEGTKSQLFYSVACHFLYNTPMLNFIDFSSHSVNGVEQCRRLFHGRGQAYEGLSHVTIDWLPPVALITLFDEVERPWLLELAQQLQARLPGCRSVQVRYRCRSMTPFEQLLGEEIESVVAEEAGLKFQLQLGRSQNTGLFLDMANGRRWVQQHAKDKRILNLFSYTCAFSVAALAGGAENVVNVDMSKGVLTRGRENHQLNQQDVRKVRFEKVDIFRSFSRLKRYGPYDLLISDPPSFQKGSVDIERDYKKIVRRVPDLLKVGGELMLCLNSPTLTEQFLIDMVEQECPSCQLVERINPPEVFVESQVGRGLKVLVFRFEG